MPEDNEKTPARNDGNNAPVYGEAWYKKPLGNSTNNSGISKKHFWQEFWHWGKPRLRPSTRKQWIIGGVVAVVLIIMGAGALKLISRPTALGNYSDKPHEKPTTEASRLTGVQISPEVNKRPVTGVMIENSPDARPQSGLKEAGVVFEAIAEGGITRFLALYLEAMPGNVGPVRSVRPYYVEWLSAFDAVIVHAGGSADGLAMIRNEGLKDLDHGANGSTFRRVSNRFAPHNLYTTMNDLDAAKARRGYTASNFTGFKRKKEAPNPAPIARTINLNISGVNYNPGYSYDAASNSYKRLLGGVPHNDAEHGQITPKVVVALVVTRSQSGIYSVYNTISTGQVFVFQDGVVTQGTWEKTARKEQITFKDEAGQPLKLNPGQTWISVISTPAAVKYAP